MVLQKGKTSVVKADNYRSLQPGITLEFVVERKYSADGRCHYDT